ncbi:aldo/keto reductase [Thozetella sp. PMI_491]|nr:aldo/keto reductase [Thozetella sp. PMI_491]
MPSLNGVEIGPIGYGMMGLTLVPSPLSDEVTFAALRASLENGCNFWNAGTFYGPNETNSLVLLERYFAKYPEDASKVVLSVKGCYNAAVHQAECSPESIRASINGALEQLKGRKKIDIWECARRDPNVPLADSFKAQQEFVDKGLVGALATSEVNAQTIHEAVKLAKIVAVEVELSLWSTDVLTNGVAAACAQYGIALVAYSPVGKGMLTGQFRSLDDIPKDSMLHYYPRFSPENFDLNVQLVKQVEELAKKKGCTPAQLAIGWTLSLSKRPGLPLIIPIPGSTNPKRVAENAVPVDLTLEELDEIDATLAKFEIKGSRYPPGIPMET